MPRFQSSIIIPVLNKWDLTRVCLKSLAATTDRAKVEVIVIDNASSDVTPQACPALGQKLFGDSFRYIRNGQNRNFAGASNQGASAADSEYLVFLNNDTEALPGWHEPLIDDFSRFANIAATGPVLLYPRDEIFGHTVQHLGVYIAPFFKFAHLYMGIPASSPLAKRRRFFQAITAACIMIPRSLFMESGMFDEAFINGFEDVDLCARLWKDGYRMTINPESHVIHYESQSMGRHAMHASNRKRLEEKSLSFLDPDWHVHLRNDGMRLTVTDWLGLVHSLPTEISRRLDSTGETLDPNHLRELLISTPYWKKGWFMLARQARNPHIRIALLEKAHLMFCDPDFMLAAFQEHRKNNNQSGMRACLKRLDTFGASLEEYLDCSKLFADWCKSRGLNDLARQYAAWGLDFPAFRTKHARFKKTCADLAKCLNDD